MTILTNPTIPELRFDPVAHRYFLGDRELVSVTTLIATVLHIAYPYATAKDRMRGVFIHRICAAIEDDDWDPDATLWPPGWIQPDIDKVLHRVEAYQQFKDDTGFVASRQEEMVWSAPMGVAGRFDLLGHFHRGRFAGQLGLIDIKTGTPEPSVVAQLALYSLMHTQHHPSEIPTVHVALQVRPDRRTRPIYRHGDHLPRDQRIALSLVEVYNFAYRNFNLGD